MQSGGIPVQSEARSLGNDTIMQPFSQSPFQKGILNQAHAEERRAHSFIEKGQTLDAVTSLQTSAILICEVLSEECQETQNPSPPSVIQSLTRQLAELLRRQRELLSSHQQAVKQMDTNLKEGANAPTASALYSPGFRPLSSIGEVYRKELQDQRKLLQRIVESRSQPMELGRVTGESSFSHPVSSELPAEMVSSDAVIFVKSEDKDNSSAAQPLSGKTEKYLIEELEYNKAILKDTIEKLIDENTKLRSDLQHTAASKPRDQPSDVDKFTDLGSDDLPPLEPVTFEVPL